MIDGYTRLSAPVDAVVLGRAKGPDEVAGEVAEQLGLGARSASDLASVVEEERITPAVVIDAVDESNAPREMMLLARSLADAGSCVAVGVHRRLASAVPAGSVWLDLDGEYRDDAAIGEYVMVRLWRGGPYDEPAARVVARAVAERARGNFLIAELAGRILAGEPEPIDTRKPGWRRRLPADLDEAFRDYLERFGTERARMLAAARATMGARPAQRPRRPHPRWLARAGGPVIISGGVELNGDRAVCGDDTSDRFVRTTRIDRRRAL